jgi:transcriptional regulator with XRE-family HTH domain
MSFILVNPKNLQIQIARRFREFRVLKNLKRRTLSSHSGVSEASIKRFETTGEISLRSLLKLALVLDVLDKFQDIIEINHPQSVREVLRKEKRLDKNLKQRGRK